MVLGRYHTIPYHGITIPLLFIENHYIRRTDILATPIFSSVVLGRNCVCRAQLLHQFIMFTVNRTSLRNSSIRRDYQFTTDHQKPYLTPNSDANSNTNSNADANADAAVDTTGTSKAYELFETRDVNTDGDLYSTSDIDSSILTTPHSQDPSVGPSDSASQTQALPLIRPRPDIPT